MKRKYANSLNTPPRKKRKYSNNSALASNYDDGNNNNSNNHSKMVCVICLSEMPSQSLHEHYSRFHNELLVPTTSKFNNVIQKCSKNSNSIDENTKQTELLCGDDDKCRMKLESIHKNKLKQKQKKIKFNVPIFELHGNKPLINTTNENYNKKKKKKRKHKKRKKNKKEKENEKGKGKENGNGKEEESEHQLTHIVNHSMPYNATGYESILNSLSKFEDNSHSLSYLLLEPTMFPSDISQCKLLIKILFEQLWNARKICDEQILFIKYLNMIDAGNRMQIHFILNELKQNHDAIYNALYRKLQSNNNGNGAWQNWKNLVSLKTNDDKINELKLNIEKMKENQLKLDNVMNANANANVNVNEMQTATIYNLKNEQSARIQKYHLSLKNNNDFFINYEKKMRSAADFDLSKALKSVDSINAPTHKAPKPDIVDLIGTSCNDGDGDDDEKWMLIIKKLLNEFKSVMDLREINDKLESLRYCSEFDVLNDMLCVSKTNNAQEIKLRFCHYFGNLSDWSFKRLIKWCQTNKFYQICQKIRSKQINGKQFIEIVTNITSVRRFFNNLTSPQVIQIYKIINQYLSDALSVL